MAKWAKHYSSMQPRSILFAGCCIRLVFVDRILLSALQPGMSFFTRETKTSYRAGYAKYAKFLSLLHFPYL